MYVLTTFDGVTLPTGQPRWQAGTAPTLLQIAPTVGGAFFDAQGADQAGALLPFDMSYDCKIVASTAASLRATLDGLRAKRGVRGKVWRRGYDDGALQWATARLLAVDYVDEIGLRHMQSLTLRWKVLSQWCGGEHGAGWTLASGKLLDAGLYLNMASRFVLPSGLVAETVTSYGNAAVEDVTLTYTAGASSCTSLTIRCGDCELIYTGTVAAGKSLVIDCGARSVTNDGSADYAHLTLGANHASAAWMRFAPGANAISIRRVGGGTGSVLLVAFYDGWE